MKSSDIIIKDKNGVELGSIQIVVEDEYLIKNYVGTIRQIIKQTKRSLMGLAIENQIEKHEIESGDPFEDSNERVE